jgi:hypothetical protein
MSKPNTAGRYAITGALGMLVCLIAFALMGMNFAGWLGAWIAPGWPWLAGLSLAAVLGVAGAWAFAVLSGHDALKKVPGAMQGIGFGVCMAVVCAVLLPLVFNAAAGDPTMSHASGTIIDDVRDKAGVRMVPLLPDVGVEPPLTTLASDDWIKPGQYGARLLPFVIAFGLYGLVVGLGGGRRKKS